MIKYIALIPAYEPDDKLLKVIDELKAVGIEAVVVDDGSGERYRGIFRSAEDKATVISYDRNMGKGAALKTGLAYISRYRLDKDSETVVVTVDADGQHLVRDVIRVARIAAARPGTLILGSRGFDENVPLRSRLGNTVTRHVFRLSTGCGVHDTQTGLRAFTGEMIPQMLEISGSRYEYEINVLMDFARRGVPIEEERIETVYIDGNSSSHFDTVRDSARVYREILKFSASSLIGFLTDYVMFAILLAAGVNLVIANIGARLVSSVTNYTINRKLVFRSDAGLAKSALKYFTLAALILAGNTVTLSVLTGTLGIGSMAAKVLTEMLFFAISWTVQRYLIFYEQADAEDARAKGPAAKQEPQYETVALSDDGNVRFVVQKKPAEVRKLTTVRPAALRAVHTSKRPSCMAGNEIFLAREVAASEQKI